MTNLYDLKLQHVIPENLTRDEQVQHLAQSLDKAIQDVTMWADKLNYKLKLDELPVEIIDHLLWENHITWNEGLLLIETHEQKVELVRNAIELHLTKGTPYAIERVFSLLGLNAQLKEWFEYGGKPYYFRVQLNVSGQGLNEEGLKNLETLMNEYKNERSHLDVLTIYLEQKTTNKSLAASPTGESVTVYPVIKNSVDIQHVQHHGAVTALGEIITVYPHAIYEISTHVTQRINCSTNIAEKIVVYPKMKDTLDARNQSNIKASVITAEDITTYPK